MIIANEDDDGSEKPDDDDEIDDDEYNRMFEGNMHRGSNRVGNVFRSS